MLIEREHWLAAAKAWVAARLIIGVAWLVAFGLDRADRFDDRFQFTNGLVAWDGTWYRLIATEGYTVGGEEVRFAPLFPAVGRVLGLPFGDSPSIGLVLLANLLALSAGAAVAAYAGEIHRNQASASMAAWATALWPGSFVLAFAYAESALITFSALSALAARRDRWWLAAGFAAAAGLVRPTGLALGLLLAGIWWGSTRRSIRPAPAVAILAPAIGFSVHLAVAWGIGDDWLAPVNQQGPFRGSLVDPFTRIWRGVTDALGEERLGDGLHLPFAVLAVLLVVLVFIKVGWPEGLMTALVVLVALSADNWNSLERYVANAFPVFVAIGIALAGIRSPRPRRWVPIGVLAASGVVMGMLTLLAWSGRYVP